VGHFYLYIGGKKKSDHQTMATLKNHYLRHTLATIAYRFQNTLHESRDNFGDFTPGQGARKTCEIINHMTQLLRASRGIIEDGAFNYKRLDVLDLPSEATRFNDELKEFDDLIADRDLSEAEIDRLLQGPISDILTHIGQLSLMRRLNGNPVGRGGFSKAPISIGKLSYF
jgi:hypothetical protein